MTGIDELRRSLDSHAHDLHDHHPAARVADVRARVQRVRRQRTGLAGAAAAVVVAAVASLAVLPGDGGPVPAERELIGREAPATIDSLGYTYHFVEGVEGGERHAELRLRPTDEPRLVTWASDAEEVGILGSEPLFHARSRATDFDDFVLVPAGQAGRWSVRAGGVDSAIAVYELGDERPPGHTVDDITFRERVGSDELLAARIGEPGEADLALEVTLPSGGEVRVAELCDGEIPEGYWVNYEVGDDGASSSDGCGGDAFDPGGAGGYTVDVEPGEAGETVPVRAWISRRVEGPAVAVEGVRIGMAVYDVGPPAAVVAGWNMPELKEHEGRLWQFVGTEVGAPGDGQVAVQNRTVDVMLAIGSFTVPGRTTVTFRAAAGEDITRSSAGGDGSDLRAVLEPGGEPARMRVRGDVPPEARLGFALYERAD